MESSTDRQHVPDGVNAGTPGSQVRPGPDPAVSSGTDAGPAPDGPPDTDARPGAAPPGSQDLTWAPPEQRWAPSAPPEAPQLAPGQVSAADEPPDPAYQLPSAGSVPIGAAGEPGQPYETTGPERVDLEFRTAGAPVPADPLFPDVAPSWQPRIIPSPPPQRGRLIRGLVIGLVVGLLAFGAGGFLAGRLTGDQAAPAPAPAPKSAPSPGAPALPPYESSLQTLNRTRFEASPDLARFAESWLPWASGCRKNGEPDGPALNPGEATRVFCEFGNLSLYFVQYKSASDRDKTRIRHLAQNVDARQLTPGVAAGSDRRATPSGHSEGSYIEYAYKAGSGATARTVSAVWWDDADTPVGAYLLAYWKDGVGESWEPIRDVWQRHA
jgi:hypothetical protein